MIFYPDKFISLREENMLSVTKFCRIAGISRTTLWHWEKGKKIPSRENIFLLASVLDISVSKISDLPGSKPVSQTNMQPLTKSINKLAKSSNADTTRKVNSIVRDINSLARELNHASLVIKGILNSVKSIVYFKDKNLKYITVNRAFLKHFSLHKTYDVCGKNDFDFFNKKDAEFNDKQDEEVFHTGEEIRKLEQFIPGTRKQKTGLISKLLIYDNDNKILGLVGSFMDITERKKSQELLEIMEHNINTLKECIVIYNDRKLMYINKAIGSIFGYDESSFRKNDDFNFWYNNCIHPDDRERQMQYRINKNWPERDT